MEKTQKYSQKNFQAAYLACEYTDIPSLGKHFAWILETFCDMMKKKQKICKKNKYVSKECL